MSCCGVTYLRHDVPGGRWLTLLANRIDPGLFAQVFTHWMRDTWPERPELVAIVLRQARDERLSLVSGYGGEVFSRFACFRIEADEELVGEGDTDDLLRLVGVARPFVERDEVGVEASDDLGHGERDGSHRGAPGPDGALSGVSSAVVGQRRQADQFGRALPDNSSNSGRAVISRATVRSATPLMERNARAAWS